MLRFNELIPELSVSDIVRSLHFYLDLLPFEVEYERKDCKFAMLSYLGSQIMIEEQNGHWDTGVLSYPYGRGINLQIRVSGIDCLYDKLISNGYPIQMQIQENWYKAGEKLVGQKEFLVMDPDGYLLRFAEETGVKPSLG